MNGTPESRIHRIGKLLFLVAAASFLLMLLCFGGPALKKRGALTTIGERTLTELTAFSVALSHYSDAVLMDLSRVPTTDESFKDLAGLLAQVRNRLSYKSLYLLTRTDNKQYQYLVDSAYRDNATAGTDYFVPETAYPLDQYQSAKALLDRIYAGKSTGGYATELTTLQNLDRVCTAYLPVYGAGNTVIAVIGVDSNPGNTGYHLLGPLNLTLVGSLSCIVFAVSLLGLAILWRRAVGAAPKTRALLPNDKNPPKADSGAI